MKILLTGDKGFVGVHVRWALKSDGHEVVGLEAAPTFREWHDEMCAVTDTDIDAVIHLGAIADNQTQDPNIYLWNSYATFLLAQRLRQKPPMPFIFFSSFLVGSTSKNWELRTPYSWSKAQAENFVSSLLPDATIIRPGVMWGNEIGTKKLEHRTVPSRLAAHTLKYLFRDWGRNYVHVRDVVEAVKSSLSNCPRGVFNMLTEYVSNQQAASFVQWDGYEWLDNPKEAGFQYISHHDTDDATPLLPDWTPKVLMAEELPKLERAITLDIASETLCISELWK